ncbi:uncharacterized protein LOC116010749 [Ipomoea triloba]|uniref:uncharacterized protein LOC116010749 n=1 Tax=Ipomoea triloba TaxID=35885 RepID=UPI00125CEE42|nr:uncharacterized protein LOC116010749 [Ipomoea triloba]
MWSTEIKELVNRKECHFFSKKSQLPLRGRRDPASLPEFQRIEDQLSRLEAQEDAFWKQRAKKHWLRGADANTRFFHRVIMVFYCVLLNMMRLKQLSFLCILEHYWTVVGENVSTFVVNCLNSCSFPVGLNDTNVVLIPKKNILESMSDLMPIAFCNVVYKIMAKLLANKMKHLLGGLISEFQSAFIPNRLITDNIFVAA